MNNNFNFKVVSAATVLALLLSASAFMLVGAQDATPTATFEEPSATASETTAATAEPSATATPDASTATLVAATETATLEYTATETKTPTGSLTATETGTATETPSTTPTPELPVAPLQPAVLDNTKVIWCPATVATPVESMMGCTASYTELSALFAQLIVNDPIVDGTVWVGNNYGNDLVLAALDGTVLVNMDTHKLTIKGGWTGSGNTINTGVPSQIEHRLNIVSWGNDLTFTDITIQNTVAAGISLTVSTSTNMTLTRVSALDTLGGGAASLDNTAGLGTVVITNSHFDNSDGIGLSLASKGNITVTGSSADGNANRGMVLDNSTVLGKTVTVTNGTINGNGAIAGLTINSQGTITLTNTTANFNLVGAGRDGAEINNTFGSSVGNVVINGGQFSSNIGAEAGLDVDSKGNITITGIAASSNPGYGAFLDNSTVVGKTVTVTTSNMNLNGAFAGLRIHSQGNITLTNTNANSNAVGGGQAGAQLDNLNYGGAGNVVVSGGQFSGNTGGIGSLGGLKIDSLGTIALTNITVDSNIGGPGMVLFNGLVPKAVTITGSQINSNTLGGFLLTSSGLVTLKDVTASYNGIAPGSGAVVDNTSGVAGITLTGTNIFSGNFTSGIIANSKGPISLNNIIANANGTGYGAYVTNNGSATAQAVMLTGTSLFNYNGAGLVVLSNGAVTANNVTADGNTAGHGVQVLNNNLTFSGGITFNGTNSMSENWEHGLELTSFGPITVNNVTADDNGQGGLLGGGMALNNGGASTFQKVTIAGVNSASSNYETNVGILSRGPIAVNSTTASGSDNHGMQLDNTVGGLTNSKQAVTLTGTNVISGNAGFGIAVESYGAINLANITANQNGLIDTTGNGAWLVNSSASTPQATTLSGVNTFSGNYNDGLEVFTDGAFNANSVTASSNGIAAGAGYGVDFQNVAFDSVGGVTFTGTNVFNGNRTSGAIIRTKGIIALNNITANSNQLSYGLDVSNLSAGSSTPKNLTLTGSNTFNSNFNTGVILETYGELVVNNIFADNNGDSGTGYGAELYNNSGSQLKKLTLAGNNAFTNNDQGGLTALSLGIVTANNLTASNNGENGGALLWNQYAGSTGTITLTGANFFEANNGVGLTIKSNGAISANSIFATDNLTSPGDGALLENDGAGSTGGGVKLTGSNYFESNNGDGLEVNSKGAITLNSVVSNDNNNSGNGVIVSNVTASTDQPVTLTGINQVYDNAAYGLSVTSRGAISVANTTASDNVGYGAFLMNDASVAPQKVAFTGTNAFNGNDTAGLLVQTEGAITSATSLTGSGNGSRGVMLSNNLGGSTAAITLLGTNVAGLNDTDGFYIYSNGVITLNNVTASQNGQGAGSGIGAYLDNSSAATPMDIKITGTNVFNGNDGAGLQPFTDGAILTNNITASENTLGAQMATTTEGKAITMTGNNYFNDNDSYGLYLQSIGPITTNNINASLNGSGATHDGAYITNDGAPGLARAVTMNGTNVFIDNIGDGLSVISNGAVTLNNVRSHFNDHGGLIVENLGPGNPALTINGINSFRNNVEFGVNIDSDGVVTVNKITAEGNGWTGLLVNPTPNNITLMCGTFTNNGFNGGGWGVDVETTVIFKRIGVFASGNNTGNIDFSGGGTQVIVRNCP